MELTLTAICAAAFVLVLWRLRRTYVRRSTLDFLPGPPSTSLLFGNLPEVANNKQAWKHWQYLAETYGPASKINALFGDRFCHIYDHKALHSILIKDAGSFRKTLAPTDNFKLLVGPGILTAEGNTHRRQRKMLNPVFSTAHLRNMVPLFYTITHQVREAIRTRVGESATDIDVNGWMARTTLEVLGQAGLGYSFDDFSRDSTDVYGESLKMLFPALHGVKILRFLVDGLSSMFSERTILKLVRALPMAKVQGVLSISDRMTRRSQEIIAEKKAALEKGDQELVHRVGEGKDIMSILLKANTAALESEKLTDSELLAQMSTFILAGMDTTSNALSRILQVLAQHPAAQEKLRAEIVEAQSRANGNGTDLDYDELVNLPYLDAVCRETLRLFAPVIMVVRVPAEDVVIPLSAPIRAKDGSSRSEIPVCKGTLVLLNLQASNVNKELWGEDALEWRPERWLEPLPPGLEEARMPGVYSNLMSFSGGSRSCIGFKFAQLEMKVVLSVLLASFKFELTDRPIFWNTSAVLYPTMDKESIRPEMILRMSAL